ncbi:peptidase C14, caspase domain-containing protein [Suillus paluster]|uniref:peptidase C14, caspase domain-containing protein n=1 Tax=Suillus paluster TaxID=48578 RepID=UPI001B8745E5|nr:peptidase C14, caspase domain-containing protein [Suillus paluster]KAG1753598.1 peptidase C14, caspase domain-containing protein [Suillus paluster]
MANPTNAGNKKALLIAVRSVDKKGFLPLHHAHEDAESLKRLLIDEFNYPEANVVLMKHDTEVLKHLWPSRKNILEQITKMVTGASANDQFFFYYSGHGNQITCKHHTETDGKDEVIYAYTGRYIVDNKLRQLLVNPLPRGSKLFALWDSCHSETILDLDHHKCNKLFSGDAVRTQRKSFTGRFFPEPASKPRSLPPSSQRQPPPRGRAGNPSLTLNSVFIQPQSPTPSWLPRMFISTSPSALRRVLSPDSWFKCTGDCEKMKPEEQKEAHVVSLSACRDNEYAYDDNETHGTVTKFFIECVSQDPKPSLFTLLKHIKDQVDQLNEKRQLQLKIVDRRATDLADRMIQEKKKPIFRRNTEVVDLDEYMSSQESSLQNRSA